MSSNIAEASKLALKLSSMNVGAETAANAGAKTAGVGIGRGRGRRITPKDQDQEAYSYRAAGIISDPVTRSNDLVNEPSTGQMLHKPSLPPVETSAVEKSENEEDIIPIAEKSLLQKVVRTGLVQNKYDLEIKRKDPSSPLHSVKSFESLRIKPELLKGIYDMGFDAPSKIQETAIPTLLADPPQNMIAQSQSGTGKTAAFVLTMLSRVNSSLDYPQALCLAPTYELAVQIGEVVQKMARYCPEIQIRYAIRGEEVARGEKLNCHIVIGTPGKVCDWGLKYRFFDLKKIKVFALDEADVMIDTQGHQDQSIRVRKGLSDTCQIMFFSATYDAEVIKFAEIIVPNAIIIRLRREEESLDNIKQFYVRCNSLEDKYDAIVNIYTFFTIGQAIFFCRSKKTASWLSEKLSQDGHAVSLLTGDLTIEQRISIFDRFREGKHRVLITTNVLARGIDIEQVTMVVNFDLPVDMHGRPECETYLHRIGRTGRFGKAGIAINLVQGHRDLDVLKQIENHFGVTIKPLSTLQEMESLAND